MKFLCLAYYDVEKYEQMPRDQFGAIVAQCPPHDAALHGHQSFLEVASLGEIRDTVSIRPRGGKPTVTDGPFMETKEQIGSFFLIEAADMAEAVRIASLHPAAHLGETIGWGVEVRPIELCKVSGT